MGRVCLICTHADRAAIEKQIVAQVAFRAIAFQWGMAHTSVERHLPHILKALLDEKAARDQGLAFDVLAQLREVNAVTLQILKDYQEKGKPGGALFAIDRLHRQMELQAKMIGLLDDRAKVDVTVAASITVNGEWITLRTALLAALAPFPEAREAVVLALERVAA